MIDLDRHTAAMLAMLKDYATREGLLDYMSALLIVREVQTPGNEAPLRMAIVGEEASTAIQTMHYAAQIVTKELRDAAVAIVGEPGGPRDS